MTQYLEGALDGLVLAQVQGLDELLDLGLPARVLLLPPLELRLLLREARVLIQSLAVHMPVCAQPKAGQDTWPHTPMATE